MMSLLFVTQIACKGGPDSAAPESPADSVPTGDSGGWADTGGPEPFADVVVSFTPGEGAGYGQDALPDVVLGPPFAVEGGGSLHVLSLGDGGEIVLELTDIGLIDGDGPDLLVFENPFVGWIETGVVAASEDGASWFEWPCDAASRVGCAGPGLVYASPSNGVDPTDPAVAGGDAFDLAAIGLARARFVRVRDSGENSYEGTAGGFDLDALAVVNGEPL